MSEYKTDFEKYLEENNITNPIDIELVKQGWNIAMKSLLSHNRKRHIYINQNTENRIKQWIIKELQDK